MPFMSMDDLMEELLFNCSPDNILDCCRHSFEGPERRRIEKLIFPPIGSDPLFESWDNLIERAWDVPAYNPADYPEPIPENVVELPPHLHIVK
jgi:hypothetical protein